MIWNLGKDSFQGNKTVTPEESHQITTQIVKLLPNLLKMPEVRAVIKYDAAMKYFESDRPSNSNVKKGAIVRQTHREGQLLAQVFLDRNNQLVFRSDGTPYGRQLVASKFDQKLRDTFGENNLIIVELKAEQTIIDASLHNMLCQFTEKVQSFLNPPYTIQVMTYEQAMRYFVEERPRDSRVKKGAIIRKTHPLGYSLMQVFLDANNDLVMRPDGKPYGRQLVAKRLDEELIEFFGNKDMLIVE